MLIAEDISNPTMQLIAYSGSNNVEDTGHTPSTRAAIQTMFMRHTPSMCAEAHTVDGPL
jgi:hypothetical protein